MEVTNATRTNTSKTRSDKAVQGTNDNSILSKSSSAAAGYFTDPFLQYFAAKKVRRAPLINRGYYIRSWIIDHVLNEFLVRHKNIQKQIISLGCGFDTLYFRLKSSGKLTNTVIAEVDFPDLMKKKHTLIKNKPALKELLGEPETPAINSPHIELCCTDYKMLGVDLTQHNLLEAALRLSGIDFDLPTLILSECVLTYMTKRCSSEVIRWAADTFQEDAVFVLYEQILPNDSFGLFMQKHYNVIGAPLKCINSFPTLESQKNRVVSHGWSWCEASDMNQIYHELIPTAERERVERIEPFDEYEEWHLKCSHYFVLCAHSNQSPGLLLGDVDPITRQSNGTIPHCPSVSIIPTPVLPTECNSTLQRFSHSSSLVSGRYLITIGGFGMQDGKHQRLSDVALTDVVSMTTQVYKPKESFEFPRMHHTSDVLEDGTVLVIFGRNSPSSLCKELLCYTVSVNDGDQSNKAVLGHLVNDKTNSTVSADVVTDKPSTTVSGDTIDDKHNTTVSDDVVNDKPNSTVSNDVVTDHKPSIIVSSDTVDDKHNTTVSDDVVNDKHNTTVSSDTIHDKHNSTVSSDVVNDHKHNITVSSDVVNDKPNTTVSSDVVNDKPNTTVSSNVVNDKPNTAVSGVIVNDKPNTTVSGDIVNDKPNTTVLDNIIKDKPMSIAFGDGVDNDNTSNSEVLSTVHYECRVDRSDDVETTENVMRLECRFVKQMGDVPCPRWRHATSVTNMEGMEYVFLYGGRTTTEVALDDSYLLDTEQKTWRKMSCTGDLPGCRQSHTLSAWSPWKLVLAGGLNEDLIPVSSVHVLHLDTLVWQRLDTVGMEVPRYSHTAHIVDDNLILVGGVNCSSSSPGISVVNLTSAVIQHFFFPVPDKDHMLLCNKHTSVFQDGHLILVGGGGNCFSFGTLLNRSPVILDISQCFVSSS
ncbi:tRNA wybutosine-synthesizing protein 4-like [Gigantopelta aegis]|uniref:tRNA wybutosine-synthesizing protein 4-like n=1 Tax=Gigantopelta aegis TaxID=1735272 RepID=UPI001B887783|nr:tRNA wybutosine-synthesizing protein 4-like [Gigantopelta aegis]